ncbi:MAG: hypothetical protein ACE37F_33600 [Nannocystaceae bacterium]|nr:hypothetical protein [bacterium]
MTTFKNKGISLVAVGLFAGITATAVQGCDEGGLCGPCGVVAEGAVSISGSAQLDGFFSAVADLNQVFVSVQADFEANVRGLAEVWGYTELGANIDADAVAGLMGHIQGEINANVQGGISLNYVPPRCSASVSVAVEAQASCEAQAGCDVEVDPGEVSVACEGQCNGGCSAECSGAVSCEASVMGGAFECEGSCEGTCALEVAAGCEGTCNGTCTVNGEVQGTEGNFEGSCAGECEGTCEMSAGGNCEGSCQGSCVVEAPSADFSCNGEPPTCRGECSGECSGSCEGTATPPSASAECDASADCQASASAQGSANFECSPPSLEFAFELSGGLDASAQAEFRGRINELRVRGAAILQGFAQLRGVIDGDINGDGSADITPPLVAIRGSLEGIIEGGASGDLFADVPPGRINCVIPAFRESVEILGEVAGNASGTISAQAQFSASLFSIAG